MPNEASRESKKGASGQGCGAEKLTSVTESRNFSSYLVITSRCSSCGTYHLMKL